MDLVVALRRWRGGSTAAERASAASDALTRDEETRMLLALPAEGQAAHFELREAWVARVRETGQIRDRATRRAVRNAALEEFESEKRQLFRSYGLLDELL